MIKFNLDVYNKEIDNYLKSDTEDNRYKVRTTFNTLTNNHNKDNIQYICKSAFILVNKTTITRYRLDTSVYILELIKDYEFESKEYYKLNFSKIVNTICTQMNLTSKLDRLKEMGYICTDLMLD